MMSSISVVIHTNQFTKKKLTHLTYQKRFDYLIRYMSISIIQKFVECNRNENALSMNKNWWVIASSHHCNYSIQWSSIKTWYWLLLIIDLSHFLHGCRNLVKKVYQDLDKDKKNGNSVGGSAYFILYS